MRSVRALWGATHPGPTLVVTTLALALGIAAGLDPARWALLAVAVFWGQVSVGLSNDAIDSARDRAVGRTDKPLARGDVSPWVAWVVAVAALVLGLVLSVPLGIGMLVAHAVTLASAWAYNAGLKATAWSVVPFLVSFGLFPSLATLAAVPPTLAPPWAAVAGAALGAAVHLTNVLPDLDDDAATGIRGLPHRLGVRTSVVLAATGIVVGAVAVLLGPPASSPASWVLFGAVLVIAVTTVVIALRRPTRAVFRLVMGAALLLAVQLVLTGTALTG